MCIRDSGKSYRFMGGDSLRPFPLVPLSTINCGWPARYSYLHPVFYFSATLQVVLASGEVPHEIAPVPVSYTHLDVYKRQS